MLFSLYCKSQGNWSPSYPGGSAVEILPSFERGSSRETWRRKRKVKKGKSKEEEMGGKGEKEEEDEEEKRQM